MYNSKISSNFLYHFTKNIDVLISILKHGFWPMTAIEDISFMLPKYKESKVGIPMVCFTDIPIELVDEHKKEYGSFGIGLKKEWGIKSGLNPVSYVLKDSELYKSFNHLQAIAIQNAQKLDNGNEDNTSKIFEMMVAFMNYAGFLKEYSSDNSLDSKPYYDEREWRYLPPFKDEGVDIDGNCNRLTPDIVDNQEEKEKLNKHMIQKYTLKFKPDDVEKIIVPDCNMASLLWYKLEALCDLYKDKIVVI